MSSIVVIWALEEPRMELITVASYLSLLNKAKDISGLENPKLYIILQKVWVEINERNYQCLSNISNPIFLDVRAQDEEEPHGCEDDSGSESGNAETHLDKATHAVDLSVMNQTNTQSGSRWSDQERAYLRNYCKYLFSKKQRKPEIETFMKWMEKRKVNKDHLFGDRSISAIFTQFRKMDTIGEFHDIQGAKKKR